MNIGHGANRTIRLYRLSLSLSSIQPDNLITSHHFHQEPQVLGGTAGRRYCRHSLTETRDIENCDRDRVQGLQLNDQPSEKLSPKVVASRKITLTFTLQRMAHQLLGVKKPAGTSKKRARSESSASNIPSPPIRFITPGNKPDVRLSVFRQEFEIPSTILKLYSAYFRKFLDSPDKQSDVPASTSFRYEYVLQ